MILKSLLCMVVASLASGSPLEDDPDRTNTTEDSMEIAAEETFRPWWRMAPMRPLLPTSLDANGLPEGWTVVGGEATYRIEMGSKGETILHGSGRDARNTFLVDPAVTGDFLLEFEVLIEADGGNSGVQIRSTVESDRMVGYQIEIDPSPRSWSGGLYDEARRGWLASLADNADARAAFVPGKWNRYTILAVGPRIRTWINDVPAIDHLDFLDRSGRIGLQVHSGRCDIRWRNLRIADLGVRTRIVEPVERTNDSDGSSRWSSPTALPDAPCDLEIAGTIDRGSLRIELGNVRSGPGYVLTVPAPLGIEGSGIVRVLRTVDSLRVLVDDAPLVPGPPNLRGPLDVVIRSNPGSLVTLDRIVFEGPTAVELEAIEASRDVAAGTP